MKLQGYGGQRQTFHSRKKEGTIQKFLNSFTRIQSNLEYLKLYKKLGLKAYFQLSICNVDVIKLCFDTMRWIKHNDCLHVKKLDSDQIEITIKVTGHHDTQSHKRWSKKKYST